jgi:hypothetical protein
MKLIARIHTFFGVKKMKKNPTHEREIRQYAKEAIKTYKKTLRKLAYE